MVIKLKKVSLSFKQEHLNKPLIRNIYHPVSVFLSWVYINLGISAHLVNLLGLFASLLAALLIFFIPPNMFFLPGAIILFAYVSDLCDGTVARFYGKKNAMGKWLDESAGFIGISAIFFVFMIKTFLNDRNILIIVLGFAAIFGYLMMNIAAILSEMIRSRFNLENPADKVRRNLSKAVFGISPSLFAFSFDVQWTIVALGVALNQPYFLFGVFAIFSNLQWMLRYIIFLGK